MKLVPLILICLLSLEVLLPCTDGLTCVPEPQQHEICDHGAESAHEHSDEENHHEHCPPGCTCFCCTAIVIPPLPELAFDTPAPVPQLIVEKARDYHFEFSHQIWQPPRFLA
ncbi:MAG: hypothetical protein GYB31_19215 [Bacteroidetes bacterium]|nr:hypothetical protein [Bacteroidota bacterium]